MKLKTFKEELKQLSLEELKVKIDSLRRDLFGLKLSASTAHIKDYSIFEKLRKNIAYALTLENQKGRSN